MDLTYEIPENSGLWLHRYEARWRSGDNRFVLNVMSPSKRALDEDVYSLHSQIYTSLSSRVGIASQISLLGSRMGSISGYIYAFDGTQALIIAELVNMLKALPADVYVQPVEYALTELARSYIGQPENSWRSFPNNFYHVTPERWLNSRTSKHRRNFESIINRLVSRPIANVHELEDCVT